MTPLTLSSGPWTIPSNSDRLWTIPSNNDWFEIGEFRTTGLIIIDFSTAGKLLAGNPVALKTFLKKLATEMAKKVGNSHPLVIGLETLVGTQFPPSIPPKPSDGH
jgi:hypothetical protein